MVMEGDLTWGGEHTIQYTDDVLYNCTPETYIILLTNVTPINSTTTTKPSPVHFYFKSISFFSQSNPTHHVWIVAESSVSLTFPVPIHFAWIFLTVTLNAIFFCPSTG